MMGLEGEGIPRRERRAILRRAFIDSVPVLMGYTTMGFVAGVLLAAKGDLVLSPLWGFLTSSLWVTGTMSIAGVPEIARRAPAAAIALMTLAVNFRYAFYGFTMLKRWKGVPLLRKAYLIMMLTDENYALEAACTIRDPARNLRYCTILSALNHSYWIVGVTVGAFAVCALEGEGQRGEDERGDAHGVEVLEDLACGAAACAAAEGSHDYDGAHAVKGCVKNGGRILEGCARGGGLSARAASGEPVAAEEQERKVAVAAGLGVGVYGERADAWAVCAQDAAEHGGTGAAYSEKEER